MKACIILLTSTFLSGFSLTLLTMGTDSISNGLASAITVLDWTAGATFASAVVAFIVAVVLEIQ
jgi:pheromone shutdown protein TraB